MSITANGAALKLLATVNVATVAESPMPTGLLDAVVSTINAAYSEMVNTAPRLFSRPWTPTLRAPKTGTVMATNGSDTVTMGTLSAPYQFGRILIEGDPAWRRIYTVGGVYKLTGTYQGTTGSHSATVYEDALAIGTTAGDRVIGEVYANGYPLTRVSDEAELRQPSGRRRRSYGEWVDVPTRLATPETGEPRYCWGEQMQTTAEVESSAEYLLFYPLPTAATAIDSRLLLSKYFIQDDIEAPDVFLTMPSGGFSDRIFIPILMHHWARTTFGKDRVALGANEADYQAALDQLGKYTQVFGVNPVAVPG